MTIRGAAKDDVLPLHKPITGRDGSLITSIPINKGQQVMIAIGSLHKNTEIYGADAKQFNPDRWLKKDGTGDLQLAKGFTVWSQILTFLGGPR
jgi:cytochrome P450